MHSGRPPSSSTNSIRQRAFPAQPQSVRAAREFVAEALAESPGVSLDDLQLMVSELTTNVIQHVLTSFHLTLERTGEEIRIEVTDLGDGLPTMRPVRPEAIDGRGLQIIDSLSSQWGVREHPHSGKTVWFTLALTPSPGVSGRGHRAGEPADAEAAA